MSTWNSSIGSLFGSSSSSSNFSLFNDSKMIKSGAYKKLMKSYYGTIEDNTTKKSSSSSTDKTSSSSSSSSSSTASKSRHACTYAYDFKKSTISTVRNEVLDKLLDKSEKKVTTSTNNVLNELLKKDKDREEAKAATEGIVTDKTETTTNGGTVTEATAGTVIDESV
ncbi:MAG: hypothetical protein HDR25_04030 [Lachnospiraceae bacterium]|nr:hypothetical protein [Lachnospiraceae bacterium]